MFEMLGYPLRGVLVFMYRDISGVCMRVSVFVCVRESTQAHMFVQSPEQTASLSPP